MLDSLRPGIKFKFKYKIPSSKTVPKLYPEALEFQEMPEVFATGFMIGLIEWTCIQAINPYLDWPNEQTLGIHVNLSHSAATPPGLTVTVDVHLTEVAGRKLVFAVQAHDGVDTICQGTHERFIISADRFNTKLAEKQKSGPSDL